MTILKGEDLEAWVTASCSAEYFSVPQAVQRYEQSSVIGVEVVAVVEGVGETAGVVTCDELALIGLIA